MISKTNNPSQRIILAATTDLSFDQRMQRIALSLSRAGYDVLLVGRQKHNSLPLPEWPFATHRLVCRFEKGPRFYAEYNARLFLFLMRQTFAIACAVDLDTIAAVGAACRYRKKTFVYDAHEFFTEVPELKGRRLVKRLWEAIGRRFVPRVDLAYTVGDSLAVVLAEKYKVPFEVIRNLPTRKSYTADKSNAPTTPYFFYQGALNAGRGLPELIEAMTMIKGYELWLAGEGDLSHSLRQLVLDLGLTDRVKFLSYVLPENLPALTANAFLGFNLLENTSLNYYYSLANKFFDYMQAAVPSVNMDFPEYRNLLEAWPCGLMLHSIQPQVIADAVQHLLQNPAMYKAMQEQALVAAGRLYWEKESNKLVALYGKLLAENK